MKKELHPSYLIFILILSVIALIILAVETAVKLDANTRQILRIADTTVCAIFLLDFFIMFFRVEKKKKYLITWGWLDLLSSIPMINSLRWGRAARILRIFRVLRGVKSAKLITQMIVERRAQSMVLAVILSLIVLISISSISILHFESTAQSHIQTPGDAIWWSVVTIATVGYGEFAPVTIEGRIVAFLLMVTGVGLFGMISGLVAAWFIGPVKEREKTYIERLENEIQQIKVLLSQHNRLSEKLFEGGKNGINYRRRIKKTNSKQI
jgi:voltage-gated potassium channel